MKSILIALLTVFTISAHADGGKGAVIGGIIGGIIGGAIGGGHHGPGHGPGPGPGPGGPGWGHGPGPGPGWGHNPPPPPYQPPYPGPGGGNGLTCVATDRGYEEHSGGHFGCGECLRYHGDCVETCSQNSYECRVDGQDRYGRPMSFVGQGPDQWRAQDQAMRNCQYGYAANCRVMGCNVRQNVVSRRNCR